MSFRTMLEADLESFEPADFAFTLEDAHRLARLLHLPQQVVSQGEYRHGDPEICLIDGGLYLVLDAVNVGQVTRTITEFAAGFTGTVFRLETYAFESADGPTSLHVNLIREGKLQDPILLATELATELAGGEPLVKLLRASRSQR